MSVARERLAQMLGSTVLPTAASVQLRAKPADLRLDVDGVGAVRFPVSAEQAEELIKLGRPARFGRGEQTLTDSRVRDTWEIPKSLIHVEWPSTSGPVLDAARDGLGLPASCELSADLHSMLVYEPGQFFAAHQDSEKDDTMIGTMVVTLPSAFTGGELVIDHGGEKTAHRGSKAAITLVAFYSDCRHEVRPVKSGHRITLTYNLLLTGDASPPAPADERAVLDLAQCLDEHFTTRIPKRFGDGDSDPPNRLVYLLDREYTTRGLSWSRLKGSDAGRASLLRTAADRAGGEAVLALADVQETWSAHEAEPGFGRWDWNDFEDEDDLDEDGADDVELQELIESTFELTQWTYPAGAEPEDISLYVDDDEVCATTRSIDMEPYASEYEGYMGNYGNTMDRWFRRAAVVVWPREQGFANRAEASPAWALDELSALARAGDRENARSAAATLAPFWDRTVRTQAEAGLLGKALQAAVDLDDAGTAELLLGPYAIEHVGPAHATALAQLATARGDQWARQRLETWFGSRPSWVIAAASDRLEWLTSLPNLCEALHAEGTPGMTLAHGLLDLSRTWMDRTAREQLKARPPSRRDELLGTLAQPLAAILTAAAGTGAAATRDAFIEFCRQAPDEMLSCVLPALRASATIPAQRRSDGGFDALAADCAQRLRTRLGKPARAADDWSIELPDGCSCELCDTLATFLRDPAKRSLEWPINKDRRQHVHSRINTVELPVRHVTKRSGRPYTLVLTKTQMLFEREQQARARDEADLAWLTTELMSAEAHD